MRQESHHVSLFENPYKKLPYGLIVHMVKAFVGPQEVIHFTSLISFLSSYTIRYRPISREPYEAI